GCVPNLDAGNIGDGVERPGRIATELEAEVAQPAPDLSRRRRLRLGCRSRLRCRCRLRSAVADGALRAHGSLLIARYSSYSFASHSSGPREVASLHSAPRYLPGVPDPLSFAAHWPASGASGLPSPMGLGGGRSSRRFSRRRLSPPARISAIRVR